MAKLHSSHDIVIRLDNYTFETTCKIYVPLSAVSSYKYRESWSKYASQIEGYDFE